MSRYIDADKLKKHASHYVRTQPHFHYGDWDNMCISGKEVDEIIDTCSTADVVEVVRCKDCKRRYSDMCAMWIDCDCCGAHADWCNDNDYCSWGERR